MSDHVTVEFDSYPWQPSSASELVEELDHWNRPTLGIIQQHGVHYLFRVLLNTDSGADLWIYSQLAWDEQQQLEQAATPAAIDEAVERSCAQRPLVAAATGPDSRVFAVALVNPVEPATESALFSAAAAAVRERTGRVLQQIRNHAGPGPAGADDFADELMRL